VGVRPRTGSLTARNIPLGPRASSARALRAR
jgi:hypothetical protein